MTGQKIHDLFALQVSKTPEKTAVVFCDKSLSYRTLDEKANQLANYLIKKGVGIEDFIPICIDRSLEMIVCILGILKAGAVYVPIDPAYPKERISYILNDTKCNAVITNEANYQLMNALVGDATLIALDKDWSTIEQMSIIAPVIDIQPNNLAYVIYTSGSTGTPKGVMIAHYSVVSLFFKDSPLYDFNEKDVWTLFHSFCFDFSVWEMYGCLLFGGRLIIVPKNIAQNARAFTELITNSKVTVLNQTPSAFYILQSSLLSEAPIDVPLRMIIYGGEALDPSKLKDWKERYPSCKLINMYGITETTVHATYQEITVEHTNSSKSVLGFSIPSLYIYVLDQNQQKVDAGIEGELYIGGAGLARGYLNLPELSAARFIKDPFSTDPTARLYRSGDLAILLEDGTFEYLGRIDDQVKVNGFRVELGEIASNINQFDHIEQCIVLAKEASFGEKKLVAYYQSDQAIDQKKLLKSLLDKMPAYMVPRIFVPIRSIPLTSNGKADKRAIEKIKIPRPDLDTLYRKAQTKTELNIYNIWNNFLEIDEIGIDDNFFELGGNSLLAQKTVALLKQHQHTLPITKLYQFPTAAAISCYLAPVAPASLGAHSAPLAPAAAEVAVIGMAGRFPGARSVAELWDVLVQGHETIRHFSPQELDASIPAAQRADPLYVA
ncbi:MAG: amino acid adenylation domain-containing protein, partial [Flavobacterium sp.]